MNGRIIDWDPYPGTGGGGRQQQPSSSTSSTFSFSGSSEVPRSGSRPSRYESVSDSGPSRPLCPWARERPTRQEWCRGAPGYPLGVRRLRTHNHRPHPVTPSLPRDRPSRDSARVKVVGRSGVGQWSDRGYPSSGPEGIGRRRQQKSGCRDQTEKNGMRVLQKGQKGGNGREKSIGFGFGNGPRPVPCKTPRPRTWVLYLRSLE